MPHTCIYCGQSMPPDELPSGPCTDIRGHFYQPSEEERQELVKRIEERRRKLLAAWSNIVPPFRQDEFDMTIGRLDRLLSILIAFAKTPLDGPNKQTLKHHAEDMIGAGQKILELLGEKPKEKPCPTSSGT